MINECRRLFSNSSGFVDKCFARKTVKHIYILSNSVVPGILHKIYINFGIGSSDCENLWIEVKLHNTKCAIGVVYRHPAPNHKEFDEKLFQVVDNLNNNKYTYFICGDFK